MKKQILNIMGRTRTFQIVLLSALAIGAASCEKEDSRPGSDDIIAADNIIQVLASYGEPEYFAEVDVKKGETPPPTFGTLNSALARAGLAGAVSSGMYTIFAPTDAAFAKLGLTPKNIASVPNLREILLYHVFDGMIYSTDLTNGFFETLGGSYAQINVTGGVMINSSNVVSADIKARNGVIHIIDNVLMPADKNLVDLALSLAPEFSILVQAVIKADLTSVLANDGPFTVFAPTNAAFVALLDELGATSLDDIPVELLTKVLLYHVVPGRVFSTDLTSGQVSTLNGNFEVSVENLTITDANGRVAGLVAGLLNVQAINGVVHVIDKVILPEID
jgi:transforming growth factor-beta-induced protein